MKKQLSKLFFILIFSNVSLLSMNFDSKNPFSEFFYNAYYTSPLKTSEVKELTKESLSKTVNDPKIPDISNKSNNIIINNATKKAIIIKEPRKIKPKKTRESDEKVHNRNNSNTINKPCSKPNETITKKRKNLFESCQYCNQLLANPRSLYNHENFFCKIALKKEIITKDYSCPYKNCPKEFTRNYELKTHIKKCSHAHE